MSVAIYRSPAASFLVEKEGIGTMFMESPVPARQAEQQLQLQLQIADTTNNTPQDEDLPDQSDIWNIIQSQKAAATPAAADKPAAPYVHPLMRRSSSLMSQKSLEMCTESLGSESGVEDFSSDDDKGRSLSSEKEEEEEGQESGVVGEEEESEGNGKKELWSVNYHCSVGRRSPPRSFPPPLPSISRRDGPCLSMRPHRVDGRLVMEAVPVPSQNYLHARRHNGRLLLSFIDSTAPNANHDTTETPTQMPTPTPMPMTQMLQQVIDEPEPEPEEDEEEEEVEVVDRGTIVEVTVSTQPQLQSGAMRVHRSSLVINKFVGGAPLTNQNRHPTPQQQQELRAPSPPHRATITTAAAAAVAASSSTSATEALEMGERPPSPDNKLLFTSKRRNREEMLHHMRRCSELRRPLFFWEPCCIATS